ncbi:hypothetical protein KIH41_00090 [Litoribacter ruber]|uniref:hypothetical protein n=1 Tax=Litoribacter ruber TaxID=702568 RepID=UPI001BDACC03|nr:hypothetical protein [Litoribacter ruber]MBT0809673.1 hypothetical protein [Litoribacter ruber]
MKKLFTIALLVFSLGSLPAMAQNVGKKEARAIEKAEKQLDKEIQKEHKATTKYLANKKKLKKYNRDYTKSSRKFERQKRREVLSPRDIRSWEADLDKQAKRIGKLEDEIAAYHRQYGKSN